MSSDRLLPETTTPARRKSGRALRREELERGRAFVIGHGASSELWASDTQFEYAVGRQRVYGMVANILLVVVFATCVTVWVLVIVWLFTRPVTPSMDSPSASPPVEMSGWVAGVVVGVALSLALLILLAMFTISIRLALWSALLIAPFELAEEFLRTARRQLEKERDYSSTNFSNAFLSRWARPVSLRSADMSWLRQAERALSFPLARGRRYRTSAARAVERRDRARALALMGWIELGLARRGEAFRTDAIGWLGALEAMTVMQDWPIDFPSDDLSQVRPTFATRLGRLLLTAVTLLLAAIPVVAAFAPGVVPSWP